MKQILHSRQIYIYSLVYFLALALGHWGLKPALGTLVFGIGGFIGLHLLDATELALGIRQTETEEPSPFRNLLTQLILYILTVFVVTSSQTNLGNGVVLFLCLRFLFMQREEYAVKGNLSSWLPEIPVEQHKTFLNIGTAVFIVISVFFILI